MANSNFIVKNGLQVGGLTISAATGDITTSGNVTVTGAGSINVDAIGVSSIAKNDSSIAINDTGSGSAIVNTIDGTQRSALNSSGLTVAGTVAATQFTGSGAGLTNIPGSQITGFAANITLGSTLIPLGATETTLAGLTSVTSTSFTGALATAAQPNITSVGTLTSLAVSGAVSTGALTVAGNLNVSGTTTSFSSNNVSFNDAMIYLADGNSGNVLDLGLVSSFNDGTYQHTGLVRDASDGVWKLFANVVAEPGTTVDFTNATYSPLQTGAVTTPSITHSGTSGVGDIGAVGNAFGTVYATATSAKYADLAENYQADATYGSGTVVMFGGIEEVTIADADTKKVAGVISTNPAHLMNGGLTGARVAPVALQGRVPCKVIGPVAKGDLMVSAGFGYAKVNNNAQAGQIIGKALHSHGAGKGMIEVVVGRV